MASLSHVHRFRYSRGALCNAASSSVNHTFRAGVPIAFIQGVIFVKCFKFVLKCFHIQTGNASVIRPKHFADELRSIGGTRCNFECCVLQLFPGVPAIIASCTEMKQPSDVISLLRFYFGMYF